MIVKSEMKPLEKTVRKRLIDFNMTLTDLSNELGWSLQYTLDVIRGKSHGPASITNKMKILNFLELDIEE
ncbi:helix-turn-helix domain-containing protein [Latilactobacillus sakei]